MPLRGLFCLRFSISAMALLAGLWPAVAGADTVSIRAGERGQGARLILDWPSPVTHTARLNGQQLTLSFARTVDADVDGLSQRLSGWISSARHSADGKQIFISLKRNVHLSSFAAGKQPAIGGDASDADREARIGAVSPFHRGDRGRSQRFPVDVRHR